MTRRLCAFFDTTIFPGFCPRHIIEDMIHPARIFTGFLIFILLILALLSYFTFDIPIPLIILGVSTVLFIVLFKKPILRYLFLALILTTICWYRVAAVTPQNNPNWWSYYINQTTKAKVVVTSEPKIIGKSQIFEVNSYSGSPRGKVEVSVNQFPQQKFGDVLLLEGKVKGIDSSNKSAKSRGVVARMSYPKILVLPRVYKNKSEAFYFDFRRNLIKVKDAYVLKTGQIVPEPEAGLIAGIIFGTKAELSTLVISFLTITSTVHIIALSGYNITIVADGMKFLTKGWSRNLAFFGPVVGILAFVLATGLSASVVRAAIMGVALLLAARVGRQSDSLNAILVASVAMAIINPYILLYDVGFQLSFAAVAGIIFLQPLIQKYFIFLGSYMGPIMAGTIAAQLFSLPVIAYYFGRVSVVGVLANAMVLPIIPLIMFLGFGIITISFASLWLGKMLGLILWFLSLYILKVTEYLSKVKFASIGYDNPSIWLVLGYLVLILELTMYFHLKNRQKLED
jgi:competence protein ComEC